MSEVTTPPSGEVIAEEISRRLEDQGVPREEQGALIRDMARTIADEIAAVLRAMWALGS